MPPLPSGPSGVRRRFELEKLRMVSLRERRPAVRAEQFARSVPLVDGFRRLFDSLPDLRESAILRTLVQRMVAARKASRPVILSLGAEALRAGIAPLVIDLMRRNVATEVALDGAAALDDLEFAFSGGAGLDVAASEDDQVAVSRESAELMSRAASKARRLGLGLGRAVGDLILEQKAAHYDLSILAEAVKLGLPATIHVGIGIDPTHALAAMDGAALGDAALRDFRTVCEEVSRLDGGVWCGIDESPILADLCARAVATARNLGFPLVAAVRARIGRDVDPENGLHIPVGLDLRLRAPTAIVLPLLRQALLTFG